MLKNYFKITWAVFRRRKFFTFINLFGIIFTLSILLIVTALLDHIFGQTSPEVNQHRTLGIYRVFAEHKSEAKKSGGSHGMASYYFLDKYLNDLPGVERTSIFRSDWRVHSYVNGQRVDSYLKYTDTEFWNILQFDFLEGRAFSEEEYDNTAYVAIINRSTRRKCFGRENAVGKTIEAAGKTLRVIGVVEDVPFIRYTPFSDIYVPLTLEENYKNPGEYTGLYTGLILAENRKYLPQIREEFISRMENIDLEGSKYSRIVSVPESLFDSVARILISKELTSKRSSFSLLMVMIVLAVLFMVLPTVNMMNLNISRILERASEIGVRKAFGAPSITLIGQFIFENVLLTIVGGIVSIGVAYLVLGMISHAGWIPYAEFSLNFRIFWYALLITLFFGLFSGIYPAWRMSRMNPVEALRGGIS